MDFADWTMLIVGTAAITCAIALGDWVLTGIVRRFYESE